MMATTYLGSNNNEPYSFLVMSNTLGSALRGGWRGDPRRVAGSPGGARCGSVDCPWL
jgi:hypothetical protein